MLEIQTDRLSADILCNEVSVPVLSRHLLADVAVRVFRQAARRTRRLDANDAPGFLDEACGG
jgi:hypothetical protein